MGCLASGVGSFEVRLYEAYTSAIDRLRENDAPADLRERLKYLLDQCRAHLSSGQDGMSEFDESERVLFVEVLMLIVTNTSTLRLVPVPPTVNSRAGIFPGAVSTLHG